MRTVLAVALCIVSGACEGNSTVHLHWFGPTPDFFRWASYDLVELRATGPLVLWEGPDGSKFQITDAYLRCAMPSWTLPPADYMVWEFLRPDGTVQESGGWYLTVTRCGFVGSMGMSFVYYWTDETIVTQDEVMDQGCLQFRKQLPSRVTWLRQANWWGREDLFERIDLPDPMPMVTYRARQPCNQPSG